GLRAGSIYPRWMADVNKGYGVATMIYYPPGFHYLSSIVHIAVKDWLNTFFVISALGLAASFFSLYWLARVFFGRLSSVVCAALYLVLPFHIFNLYYQGAMPQFLGYIFMPLVLYSAFRLGERGEARYYAALGLLYAVYLLTHLPVSYLFTYVLASYAVVWAIKERNLRIALRIAGGMAIGLLVSAVYWLPAALESKFAYEWASELMPYHTTYLTLLESKNTFGLIINLSFVLLVASLASSIWVLRTLRMESPGFAPSAEGRRDQTARQIQLWTFLGVLTAFMSTSFSIYLSKLIPRIQVATPAWRWLSIAGLFASLLVGAAVERLTAGPTFLSGKRLVYSAALAASLALSLWITVRYVIVEAVRSNPVHVFAAEYLDFGFTPRNSTPPDRLPETPLVMIRPESGVSEIGVWGRQHREIFVRVDQPSEVRLKTYHFPGWVGRIDGQSVQISSDVDGAQLISVPPGIHKIEMDFVDTVPRRLGALSFCFGLTTIAGLLTLDYRKRRALRIRGPRGEVPTRAVLDSALARHIRPKSTAVVVTIVVAAGLIGAVSLAGWFSSGGKTPSGSGVTQGSSGSENTMRGTSGGVGSETRLYIKGQMWVPVAVDEKTLDELIDALSTRKTDNLETLADSRRMFRVDNDTRIRILEIGSGKVKVRVVEGPHVTMDGWIYERWVR
ncbi:MAG: 6-pyruvoyl-tetrahydropterin synthase-related protein, partial [Blastocatellia bacterium]